MSMIDPYRTASGQLTAEEEIAARAQALIRSNLRADFTELLALQRLWLTNGMEAKIVAATQNNETLVGYSPAVWALWGEVLRQFILWFETPNAALVALGGSTPEAAVFTNWTVAA